MFGIGWTEFFVIALVLLIFVGPRHLPGVLRKAGMIIAELKNASRELRNQVTEEVRELEQVVGTVKSPRAFVEDLGRDITDEMGSPYDEIYEAEAAVKKEITSIKSDLEGDRERASASASKSAEADSRGKARDDEEAPS